MDCAKDIQQHIYHVLSRWQVDPLGKMREYLWLLTFFHTSE